MDIRSALGRMGGEFPERDALWIGGKTMTYAALTRAGNAIVRTAMPNCSSGVIALIGERNFPLYCAIFGCLTNGFTYVPINPKWPASRMQDVIARASPDVALLDDSAAGSLQASNYLDGLRCPAFQTDVDAQGEARLRQLNIGSARAARGYELDDLAYIIFTSGSTGIPKGVPIRASNVSHYVASMAPLAGFTEEDRVIQIAGLSFDLSVHDLMLCWYAGAMLAVVPESYGPMAPRFVKRLEITSWCSVPSVAARAKTLGLLDIDTMPSLRTSFFCGEALPTSLAETWLAAAPNSRLYNIYGPTEATVAVSSFEVVRGEDTKYDVVPLGRAIGRQKMALDEHSELLLSGPQLSPGYLLDPDATRRAFVEREGARWYRTGDRALFDEKVGFVFRGRVDSQIKISGYRVEIGEVETAMRKHFGTDLVAAVPVRELAPSNYEALVGFVCGAATNFDDPRRALLRVLPFYMVPERVVRVPEMPKTANDKIDYLLLKKFAEGSTRL